MGKRWRSAAVAFGLSIIGLAALVTGALVSPLAYARPVSAATPANPPCSAEPAYDFVGWGWTPSNQDVEGVRAPINMRTDGLLCSNIHQDPFAANWIAIVQQNGSGITQIGFVHEPNSQGQFVWCRFWAIGEGVSHDYDCGVDPNNTFVYFRVQQYLSGLSPFYKVEDCGTEGDFNHCTTMNGTQPAYADPASEVASETDFGCEVYMLGSTSDAVQYGNSSWRLDGESSSGWAPRTWSAFKPRCTGDYSGTTISYGMRTWDTRNAK